MKRIISLFLLLTIAILALSSCGLDYIEAASSYLDNHPIDEARTPVTLNFYIPSGGEVSSQAAEAMEEKFNQIIEAKYMTHVEFVILNSSEYAASLDEKLTKSNIYSGTYEQDKKAEPIRGTDGVTMFPGVADHQLDIFVSVDYAKFDEYIGKSFVKDITEYMEINTRNLSGIKDTNKLEGIDFPKISEVIFNNSYYYSVEYENDSESTVKNELKQYFGIPSAYPIGSYDYLIVDKAEADKYYTKDYFLEDATVAGGNDKVNRGRELLNSELLTAGISQAEIDENHIISLKSAGYEARLPYQESGRYYISVLKKPAATYEEVCSAMTCISQRTVNTERAFEVLYELNTNPMLHTILQYGAQDITYRYDTATHTVSLISGAPAYNMDIRYTGNFFTILPCTNAPVNGGVKTFDDIKYLSLQNQDAKVNNIAIHKSNILRKNIEKLLKGDLSLYTNDVPDEGYIFYDEEQTVNLGSESKSVTVRHRMDYNLSELPAIAADGTETMVETKIPTSYSVYLISREAVADREVDRTVYGLSIDCTTGDYTMSYHYLDDEGNAVNSVSSTVRKFPVTSVAKISFSSVIDEEEYVYTKDITAADVTDIYELKIAQTDTIVKDGETKAVSSLPSQTVADFTISASSAFSESLYGISAILGISEDNLKLYDTGFTKFR